MARPGHRWGQTCPIRGMDVEQVLRPRPHRFHAPCDQLGRIFLFFQTGETTRRLAGLTFRACYQARHPQKANRPEVGGCRAVLAMRPEGRVMVVVIISPESGSLQVISAQTRVRGCRVGVCGVSRQWTHEKKRVSQPPGYGGGGGGARFSPTGVGIRQARGGANRGRFGRHHAATGRLGNRSPGPALGSGTRVAGAQCGCLSAEPAADSPAGT